MVQVLTRHRFAAQTRTPPRDGAYLAIRVELAGVAVLVDLYLWPQRRRRFPPAVGVLYTRTTGLPRSDLESMPVLDRTAPHQ